MRTFPFRETKIIFGAIWQQTDSIIHILHAWEMIYLHNIFGYHNQHIEYERCRLLSFRLKFCGFVLGCCGDLYVCVLIHCIGFWCRLGEEEEIFMCRDEVLKDEVIMWFIEYVIRGKLDEKQHFLALTTQCNKLFDGETKLWNIIRRRIFRWSTY